MLEVRVVLERGGAWGVAKPARYLLGLYRRLERPYRNFVWGVPETLYYMSWFVCHYLFPAYPGLPVVPLGDLLFARATSLGLSMVSWAGSAFDGGLPGSAGCVKPVWGAPLSWASFATSISSPSPAATWAASHAGVPGLCFFASMRNSVTS